MKITQRHLTIALFFLLAVLLGYSLIRATTGLRLPGQLDAELPNVVIFGALAIFLYGRKLRSDAAKAAAAAKTASDPEANVEADARNESDRDGPSRG